MVDNVGTRQMLVMAEICAEFRKDAQTIRRWIRNDGFPAAKLKREWLFDRAAVDAWKEAQLAAGTPERTAV